MTKQKVGLVLFWMAVIWAMGWGVIGSVFVDSAFRTLTMDELNLTMWANTGPWTMIWGLFGVPLAAIVAIIGILLYSDAKGSTILKYGIGIFLAGAGMAAVYPLGHIPLLFGIGGTLILLFFIGILWLWAKERMALKETSSTAAYLKLAGYMFMLIAAWFICGMASQPFLKALENETPYNPILVMIFLVLGWLFLFLGHYKSRQR
ncbi:MAG: hypothetical protein JSV96_07645 [Candidatus Aminicenantes bacterium]|nr:MAG: hypothetical protein JSV96_07645 [Candidatus Aminicenantes bacterium]